MFTVAVFFLVHITLISHMQTKNETKHYGKRFFLFSFELASLSCHRGRVLNSTNVTIPYQHNATLYNLLLAPNSMTSINPQP